jgi:hypothetical protein
MRIGKMGWMQKLLNFNTDKNNSLESEAGLERPDFHAENIGSPGTSIYSGYFDEDYLDALKNKERADVFDKMRRSDPQIKMILSAVKNPIKASCPEIHPAGEEIFQKNDARLIEKVLFESMQTPFNRFLSEALTMIEYGFSMFEVTHKNFVGQQLKDEDGNIILNSYTGIKNLSWRSPKTIERWNVDHGTGDLLGVTQYVYGDLDREAFIPAKYLLLFTNEREGSNYEGISWLRPCYGNWWRKNNFNKLNAIGIEKHAIPTPVVTVPQGKQTSTQYNKLITALEKYTTHQSNYLTMPAGFELNLNTNTYDPSKVETSIENEDKRMTKAFLANFLELGMSGTGAYALSNDLSDFFLTGLEHLAKEIAEPINKYLIPEIVKMNFGPREKYPTLSFAGISDKAGKELAETLSILTSANLLVPDKNLEKHLRKRLKITEINEEDQRPNAPKFQELDPEKLTLSEKLEMVRNYSRSRNK